MKNIQLTDEEKEMASKIKMVDILPPKKRKQGVKVVVNGEPIYEDKMTHESFDEHLSSWD